MRSILIRGIGVVLIAGGVVLGPRVDAIAGPTCHLTDSLTGTCKIQVQAPGAPSQSRGTPAPSGPKDTGSGQSCYWDPSKQGVSGSKAGPVSCTSPYGYWSNTYNCYIQLQKPQPPAGDPSWKGHKPGDGAVYSCYQPQTTMLVSIWAKASPPQARTGPTPRQVAEQAVKEMNLSAIDIGIVPRPGPNSVGLVGMPVWMWVQAPNGRTYGPQTASASAGGITVTATAKVVSISWDMGDGTTVVCHSAGTPYLSSYGKADSPDCGHVYQKTSADQPGGSYTVTATSDWAVRWSGAGQTGTIRLGGLTRSTRITVGEAQVLVQ